MITISRIIKIINEVNDSTPVKFNNFGAFLLELFMLPIEEQRYVAENLLIASLASVPDDNIIIYSIERLQIDVEKEWKLRFLIKHSFKCKMCGNIIIDRVNVYNSCFKDYCQECIDDYEV